MIFSDFTCTQTVSAINKFLAEKNDNYDEILQSVGLWNSHQASVPGVAFYKAYLHLLFASVSDWNVTDAHNTIKNIETQASLLLNALATERIGKLAGAKLRRFANAILAITPALVCDLDKFTDKTSVINVIHKQVRASTISIKPSEQHCVIMIAESLHHLAQAMNSNSNNPPTKQEKSLISAHQHIQRAKEFIEANSKVIDAAAENEGNGSSNQRCFVFYRLAHQLETAIEGRRRQLAEQNRNVTPVVATKNIYEKNLLNALTSKKVTPVSSNNTSPVTASAKKRKFNEVELVAPATSTKTATESKIDLEHLSSEELRERLKSMVADMDMSQEQDASFVDDDAAPESPKLPEETKVQQEINLQTPISQLDCYIGNLLTCYKDLKVQQTLIQNQLNRPNADVTKYEEEIAALKKENDGFKRNLNAKTIALNGAGKKITDQQNTITQLTNDNEELTEKLTTLETKYNEMEVTVRAIIKKQKLF